TDSTISEGIASNLIWRTPDSGEGTFTPSMVALVNRGSVPRTCTYLPSPSSRSSVTLGSRPTASAMLALGRLVITSFESTWRILSAVRWRFTCSTSPEGRSAVTKTWSLWEVTSIFTSTVVGWPAAMLTTFVKRENPTYVTVMVYVPGTRLLM